MRKVSAPGPATSSTPAKPTTSTSPRTLPTFSFSHSAAASVANSGAEKLMAAAPPSGISPTAMVMQLCATDWVALRAIWAPSRCVRNTAKPCRGRISSAHTSSEPKQRKNSTSAKE